MTKSYIDYNIINPLKKCASEGRTLTAYEIFSIEAGFQNCATDKEHLYILEKLRPQYEDYMKGIRLFKNYSLNLLMDVVCSWDVVYGIYITKLDLIETAISWANNNSDVRVHDFLHLLMNYSLVCPTKQLDNIERKVWQEMTKLEVYGNRKKAGYLVLLHGFLRIVIKHSDPSEQKRLIELFIKEWDYLKLVYSVMIRCIVDCGHQDFAGVANNVRIMPRCHPYIHIFYAVLAERFNDLCQAGTDRTKLSNHLTKIIEINYSTTQNIDYLDQLCITFFPDSFQEYLEKNRMPSYDEVVSELQEMKAKVDILNNQIEQMAQRMVNAVKASIPIEDIEKELLRLSPGTGYDVFTQVNSLLIGNKAWMERANDIKQKILEQRDKPTTQNIMNIELVEKKEMNIDKNYGPNIDNHDGGVLGLPNKNKEEENGN